MHTRRGEQICGADLDVLGSLVDQSLLRRSGDRYWMLETIREYAVERLAESGEADVLRTLHAHWYVELAERARPELHRARAREWLDLLEAEHANLRLALENAFDHADGAAGLRLSGAVWPFWLTRGHWTEGRRWLEDAIELADEHQLESGEDALWGAALLAYWQVEEQSGLAHATKLLDISRARGLTRGEAIALELIAIAASQRGEFDRARTLFEESLPLAREVEDDWLISVVLNNLGDAELNAGNLERAIELFEESLEVGERQGDIDRRARELQNLGSAQLALGDTGGARVRFEDALEAALAIGLREIYVYGLLGLAATWVADDPSRAARLQGVSDAIAKQLGTSAQVFEATMREKTLTGLRTAGAEDAYLAALTEVDSLGVDDAVRSTLATPNKQRG